MNEENNDDAVDPYAGMTPAQKKAAKKKAKRARAKANKKKKAAAAAAGKSSTGDEPRPVFRWLYSTRPGPSPLDRR